MQASTIQPGRPRKPPPRVRPLTPLQLRIGIGVWVAVLGLSGYIQLDHYRERLSFIKEMPPGTIVVYDYCSTALNPVVLFCLAAACFESWSALQVRRQNLWLGMTLAVLGGYRIVTVVAVIIGHFQFGGYISDLQSTFCTATYIYFFLPLVLLFLGATVVHMSHDAPRLPRFLRISRWLLLLWLLQLAWATFATPLACVMKLSEIHGKADLRTLARWGRIDLVRQWLAADKGHEVKGEEGADALRWAAQYGHLEVVQVLLAAGVQINEQDAGARALERAADFGKFHVVRFLLAAGVNVKDSDSGSTALVGAASYGQLDVLQSLLAVGVKVKHNAAGAYALEAAACGGQAKALQILLDAGASDEYYSVAQLKAAAARNRRFVLHQDSRGTLW